MIAEPSSCTAVGFCFFEFWGGFILVFVSFFPNIFATSVSIPTHPLYLLCFLHFIFVLSHLWPVKSKKNPLVSDGYLALQGAVNSQFTWQEPARGQCIKPAATRSSNDGAGDSPVTFNGLARPHPALTFLIWALLYHFTVAIVC